MFDFCPHCGQTIEHEQVVGQMLVCAQCGKDIGFVGAVDRAVVSEAERQIRTGQAAVCSSCGQIVELRSIGPAKSYAAHYPSAGAKKICPGSGKPAAQPETKAPTGRDLSSYMTRGVIQVLYCPRAGEPRIDVLTLDYLDKSQRVRIQIEALREMMGADFRIMEYPPSLNRPHLALWGSAEACVVASKHEQGGFQSLTDDDFAAVLTDVMHKRHLFF